jgi:hypothetical protein
MDEKFYKDTGIMKNKQTEILQMENSINQIKGKVEAPPIN